MEQRSAALDKILAAHQELPQIEEARESIERFLERYLEALRSGNLDRILTFLDSDLVSYDMPPPLVTKGLDAYEAVQKKYFLEPFEFPIESELRDLVVQATEDFAVAYGLMRVAAKFKESGEQVENWLRVTLVLRNKDGIWLIKHAHHSVPIGDDLKAQMDLRPENSQTSQATDVH